MNKDVATHRMNYAGQRGRSVPHGLQTRCFKRDNYTCQYPGCGYQGQPGDGTLHADHKHNRATGGADTLDNLETLCTTHHALKTRTETNTGRRQRAARGRYPTAKHPGLT